MSPWDAFRWFDTPSERTFTVPLGSPIKVAGLNVRRVGLLLAVTGGGTTVSFSTKPITDDSQGVGVTVASGPLVLTQAQHGVLCQVEWWAFASAGTTVTVIETLLRDWPHTDEGPPGE